MLIVGVFVSWQRILNAPMRQRVQRQEEYRIRLFDLDYLSWRLIIRHISAQDSIKFRFYWRVFSSPQLPKCAMINFVP